MDQDSAMRRLQNDLIRLNQKTRLSKDDLTKWLGQLAKVLSHLEPSSAPESAKKLQIKRLCEFILKHNLLKLGEEKRNEEVKLWVAVCVSEIFRIVAPELPFEDEHLQDVFKLINNVFWKLDDTAGAYFLSRAKILGNIARCQCCVIMLDIDCSHLIVEMFHIFFSVVSEHHQPSLIKDMLSIMGSILNEEASQSLVDIILRNLIKGDKDAHASQLASSVIQASAEKLEPYICQFLSSCILDGDTVHGGLKEFYHEIIFKVFQCAPQLLLAVIPTLTHELLTDQVDVRIKAVNLVGKLFALPEYRAAQKYRDLFVEFLRRFSDKSAEVRATTVQCAKAFCMANPSGHESHEVLIALEDRLLDFDDRVRTEAVAVVCDLAKSNLKLFPPRLIGLTTERLRDRKMSVRKKAMQNLINLYHEYSTKCSEGCLTRSDHFEQIPCKLLMLCYEKDCKEFRPQTMELVLSENLFPLHLSVEDRTGHWMHLFSLFTPLHMKSLNSILGQKRRFQTEMQSYLALRKKEKEKDPEEMQKRLKVLFMRMSASFPDSSKAEEGFCRLKEMKDNSIFNAVAHLLDEVTFISSQTIRDNFLKDVGNRHPLFEFLHLLSAKCSFNIFSSNHVHCILDHLSRSFVVNKYLEASSVELLQVIITNFPSLLRGLEVQLKMLLESEPANDKLIEVLVKAGPYISAKQSDFYPHLERLCKEGTRSQAKSAVAAIAALNRTSEQMCFSGLCKDLVNSLHAMQNLPTILQSLGCIAQYSVSTFEAQDEEITPYIYEKILMVKPLDAFGGTSGCCESCKLKIYGLKTLVRSFLPHQRIHVMRQVNELLDILTKMLQKGGTSDTVISCERDKDHFKLAAAKSILRLSKIWNAHISPKTFQAAILVAKEESHFVRKSFLDKIFKLLQGRAIPLKFACAFALASSYSIDAQLNIDKYMEGFVKGYNSDARISQKPKVQGGLAVDLPAYVVVFLIHILAHDGDFPPDHCQDGDIYAKFCSPLYFVLQAFVNTSSYSGDNNPVNDAILYLSSIFRAIRKAEDAVDSQKTHKLHILADIGTGILSSLNHDNISLSNAPGVILLPSSLYRISSAKSDQTSVKCPPDGNFVKRVVEVLRSHGSLAGGTQGKVDQNNQEDGVWRNTLDLTSGKEVLSTGTERIHKRLSEEIHTGQQRKRAASSTVNRCRNVKSKNSAAVLHKECSPCDSLIGSRVASQYTGDAVKRKRREV